MTEVIVRTQGELDAALKDPANRAIMIASEDDVTLDVSGTAGKNVGARSGILRVYGDARIGSVFGDAQIESVFGDARIGSVFGDAHVGDVYGAARIEIVYGDAHVGDVYGAAQIEIVYGDAHVGDVYGNAKIEIVSGDAHVGDVSGNAKIESVYGDAHVGDVSGAAHVGDVFGAAHVGDVYGDAHVGDVYGNAKIESVYGDAHVGDVSGAAHVGDVFGAAQIESVSGDAHVGDVSGNAKIEIVFGNAKIRHVRDESKIRHVRDKSTIMVVRGSVEIESVYGYAMVSLYDYARVKRQLGVNAIAFVHSPDARVSGAHVIDMTGTESHDPEMWAAHTTADVLDGEVVLWKALGADLTSGEEFGRPVKWEVGQEVSCDDWNPTPECGGGLHLSPHPYDAIMYRKEATRMLKCSATMSEIVPIIYNNDSDKCKVKSVRVIAETNMDGTPLTSEEK